MAEDIAKIIRERIHAEFDGECHLTEAEAWRAADEIKRLRANLDASQDMHLSALRRNCIFRDALEKISSPTQTEGLLWWQVEARAALAAAKAAKDADHG